MILGLDSRRAAMASIWEACRRPCIRRRRPETATALGGTASRSGRRGKMPPLRRFAMKNDMQTNFERGAVILSIDTEQIWGYLDLLNEAQFEEKYPNALLAHEKLLDRLCAAGVG